MKRERETEMDGRERLGCPEWEERLLLHLDGELPEGEARSVEEHLERCPRCREAFARQRAVEAALRRVPEPAGGDGWVVALLSRARAGEGAGRGAVPSTPAAPPAKPFRRVALLAAAAAVLLCLLWWGGERKIAPPAGPAEVTFSAPRAADRGAEAARGERKAVQAELDALLRRISERGEADPAAAFERGAAPLRARGWKVEFLLAGALRRLEGEALRTALRVAAGLPGFTRVPGALSALAALLDRGAFPEETTGLLAAAGGPRAVQALGRALRRPELREEALSALARMGGAEAVRAVERELLYGDRRPPRTADVGPEKAEALRVLAGMGPEGTEAVVAFCRRCGFAESAVRALEPVRPRLGEALEAFAGRASGRALEAGLRLAAELRMEWVLPRLFERGKKRLFTGETPFLAARVGGAEAVRVLGRMYEAPVSIKTRRRIALALADLFRRRGEEMEAVLARCLCPEGGGAPGAAGGRPVPELEEMLARVGDRAACRALAWIVTHVPERASGAALALARAGTREALDELLALLSTPDLPEAARVSAAAAAYHLGGREALEAAAAQEAAGLPEGPGTLRRLGTLTEARFEDLRHRVASWVRAAHGTPEGNSH